MDLFDGWDCRDRPQFPQFMKLMNRPTCHNRNSIPFSIHRCCLNNEQFSKIHEYIYNKILSAKLFDVINPHVGTVVNSGNNSQLFPFIHIKYLQLSLNRPWDVNMYIFKDILYIYTYINILNLYQFWSRFFRFKFFFFLNKYYHQNNSHFL